MAGHVPLSLAVPAASALFAYLDAKFHIRYDWKLISSFIGVSLQGTLREKRDRLNLFYTLEEWAQAPSHKDKAFLLFNGRSWTYGQTYEKVLRYGAWIKRRFGVQEDEVVAMDFVNSDAFVFVWFALWAIGAKPAFINYNLTDKPLLHSIKTSSARVVLVDPRVKQCFNSEVMKELLGPSFRDGGGAVKVCFLDDGVTEEIEATPPKREPDSERSEQLLGNMALLIYTSGTTGLPKPAIVTWGKAALAPKFVGKWIPLKADDIMYTCMPLYHSSASLLCLCSVLAAGTTLSLGERFHRSQFWADVRATRATVIQYVGETCRYLLSAPPSPLDTQHAVRCAFGNGLRPDVWPRFKSRFAIDTIVEFYAATEAPSAMWNRSRNAFGQGAVGLAGPLSDLVLGRRALILALDDATAAPRRDPAAGLCVPAAPGQPGELVYRLNEKDLAATFQGYFRNGAATSAKVLRDVRRPGDAWFSTGDVLCRDPDGRWFFRDRIGDTFRWKSENVATAEVADVLGAVDSVAEANVYGVEVPAHDGRAGCAALVLGDGQARDAVLDEMARHALRALPRYAVPVFVRVLSDESARGNRTGTNKQQKHVLRGQGVDPAVVERDGDALFWLRPGAARYERFGPGEYEGLRAGRVKL